MALKTFKPYTKSTRGTILVDRTGLWKGKPFKTLVSHKNAMKGRNNNGHITSINRAGGHKKMYRHVDFYRKKFDIEATVEKSNNKIQYKQGNKRFEKLLDDVSQESETTMLNLQWTQMVMTLVQQ